MKIKWPSIDGKYYFTEKDVLDYQVMYSSSENPSCGGIDDECPDFAESSPSDRAVSLSYRHNEEDYSFRASYNDFGKDFRADLGFITQVDYKKFVLGGEYVCRGEEGSNWTRWGVFGDVDRTEDQSGLLLEEEAEIHMFVNGPNQFRTNFGIVDRNRYFDGEYFDEKQFMAWFMIKPWSNFTFENFMRIGDQIDFT